MDPCNPLTVVISGGLCQLLIYYLSALFGSPPFSVLLCHAGAGLLRFCVDGPLSVTLCQ